MTDAANDSEPAIPNKPRVAVLGCGTMGQSLVKGMIGAGVVPADHIRATVRR